MALALTIYEDSLTEYGLPASVVYDHERGTWLEVEEVVDYGAAAKERWAKDNPNPEPGTRLKVVDTWPGDSSDERDGDRGEQGGDDRPERPGGE